MSPTNAARRFVDSPDSPVFLTVCVIGKNEADNLPGLVRSLRALQELPYRVETIFVDSASTDDTVEIAKVFFDQVFVLKPSRNLCASAARYVSTGAAAGRWLLYLDGDMELSVTFLDLLSSLRVLDDTGRGWVGIYHDCFPDGATRPIGIRLNNLGVISQFGGAVLLSRELVLRAGNWNPAVFSNEEIDLYTRMRRIGGTVVWHPVLMVTHITDRVPAWRVVVGNVIPSVWMGKKCYGFGQIIASRIRGGGLWNFIRWYPVPFFCWASTLGALATGLIFGPLAGAALFAVGFGGASFAVGWKRAFLFNLLLGHAVMGIWHYDSAYVPEIAAHYTPSPRTDASDSQ